MSTYSDHLTPPQSQHLSRVCVCHACPAEGFRNLFEIDPCAKDSTSSRHKFAQRPHIQTRAHHRQHTHSFQLHEYLAWSSPDRGFWPTSPVFRSDEQSLRTPRLYWPSQLVGMLVCSNIFVDTSRIGSNLGMPYGFAVTMLASLVPGLCSSVAQSMSRPKTSQAFPDVLYIRVSMPLASPTSHLIRLYCSLPACSSMKEKQPRGS